MVHSTVVRADVRRESFHFAQCLKAQALLALVGLTAQRCNTHCQLTSSIVPVTFRIKHNYESASFTDESLEYVKRKCCVVGWLKTNVFDPSGVVRLFPLFIPPCFPNIPGIYCLTHDKYFVQKAVLMLILLEMCKQVHMKSILRSTHPHNCPKMVEVIFLF